MNEDIQKDFTGRGITRLCHFTPSRSLSHILAEKEGILSSQLLKNKESLPFNPTDPQRLDGHDDYICCSIEYPNTWYLDRARTGEMIFRDWVVVFIDPRMLAADDTLFCPRNAAAGYGAFIASGYEAYSSMFAQSVTGAHGRTRTRTPAHLPCSPTDDQAEVLVPDLIPLENVLAIGVASEEQARAEQVRLEILGISGSGLQFVVSPTLFDKHALSTCIRAGRRPPEKLWNA